LLTVFQRLAQSNLISQLAAGKHFKLGQTRGRAREAESFRPFGSLERTAVECSSELALGGEELKAPVNRSRESAAPLSESEEQLRAVFESALDAMILLDDARNILEANQRAQELFGYGLAELRSRRWDALVPTGASGSIPEPWRQLLEGATKRGEIDVHRADGSLRHLSFSARANIQPGRHLIILRDVTENRETEDSLRFLSQKLIRLQDEERRRIARELHDSTGQYLAALAMHLDGILSEADALPTKVRKLATEAVEICRNCSTDIRTTSYLLHPPLLDEVGLLPALDWYVSGFSERSGVRVAKEICEPRKPLSNELNTALFRIIQEALVNIHKHADSKEARIRLKCENGKVVLEISDSGKGIDAAQLRNGRIGVRGLGVGITGMRERVRQLGGTLEIEAANPGTLIRAAFPIIEENENGNA
jgi:PAS domain S-box-containing protein